MRERILAVIEKNSRISVKELADLLGEIEAAGAAEIAENEQKLIDGQQQIDDAQKEIR